MKTLPEVTSPYGKGIFPRPWQTVIFINYGRVRSEVIGRIIGADEATVEREAARMGLGGIAFDPVMREKGYISLIRDNWHFLSYSDIARLLEESEEQLYDTLINDDFLIVKMGEVKPTVESAVYSPLTPEEAEATDGIRKLVESSRLPAGAHPFDFFAGLPAPKTGTIHCEGERLVYCYDVSCGDAFLSDEPVSDELLARLAEQGVNGIFMQSLLSALSPYPFAKTDGKWETRRKNLKRLCEKCARYGIKVWLYANEPRALADDVIPKELAGHSENGFTSLCISHKEVRDYVVGAVEGLCRAVPDLGGFLLVTMSENQTHCKSMHNGCTCPNCSSVPAWKLASTVVNLFAEGAKRSGTNVRVVAHLWGWAPFMGWSEQETMNGIANLDKSVDVLLVSEYGVKMEKGGVPTEVIDYSIPNYGPGELSRKCLTYARELGHRTWAKIQMNVSWECSAVPALPVYELFARHLDNLAAIGVDNFMLGWTLGGYPSAALRLATEYFRPGKGVDLDSFYRDVFGSDASVARAASEKMSEAFREFPFSLSVLYFAPHTLGGGELWCYEPIGLEATMVAFAYDDIEKYSAPFGPEIYISQMEKLVKGWKQGLDKAKEIGSDTPAVRELKLGAEGAYLQFLCAARHAEFTAAKAKGYPDRAKAAALVKEQSEAVKRLYALTRQSACVGYEASNGYYYCENTLLLGLVALSKLEKKFTE